MKSEYYLFDLPDELYVKLTNSFRFKLFDTAIKLAGNGRKLSKLLNTRSQNVYRWKCGRRSCSIRILHRIVSLGISSEKEIEINIQAIKKRGGEITNPKLPIIVDENLAVVIASTLCDGGIGKDYAVHYTNKNPKLLNSFKNSVYNAFGEVKILGKYERHEGVYQLLFSGVLGIILHKLFEIPKGAKKFDNSSIPKIILEAEKRILSCFIRRCFDDEGWVTSGVKISRTNSKNSLGLNKVPLFLTQLRSLLERRFDIKVNGPRVVKEKEYLVKNKKVEVIDFELTICDRESLEKFYSCIGFDVDYKMKSLKNRINSYKIWQARNGETLKFFLQNAIKIILENERPFSSQELAIRTRRTKSRACEVLKELKKRNLIKIIEYQNPSINKNFVPLYTVTNKGLRAIFNFVEI